VVRTPVWGSANTGSASQLSLAASCGGGPERRDKQGYRHTRAHLQTPVLPWSLPMILASATRGSPEVQDRIGVQKPLGRWLPHLNTT
jgi:hypothetical protein